MAVIPFKVTACLILFTFTNLPILSSLNTDGLALLALKAAITTDPTDTLASWSETDPTPCHWHGITCINDRVTSLSLPDKNFTGYIPFELGLLGSLAQLTLSRNNFSKSIPSHLFNATTLRFLDLSHNSLSGSYGFFPVMVSLDLRHNNLSGKVPLFGSLVNQGPTAFAGNPSLCGFPLQTACPEAVNITVSDSPENPKDPNPVLFPGSVGKVKVKTGSVAVPLISGFSVVIGVVTVSVWLYRKKRRADEGKMGKEEKIEKGDNNEVTFNEEQKGKFVVMDEGFNLELEDLLRASAYVVGKSRSGIVYKVVVGGGGGGGGGGSGTAMPTVVAVRRLSEGDATWKLKEFESEVEAIERVHHPNIARLRAYYFAHDEKLLVSDFIRNGSLYSALHGGPSNTLPVLSWTARLKIAQGTARGLMYIHEHSPRNSKFSTSASKKQYLNQTISSAMGLKISAPSNIYLAPEARVSGSKFSQKCDVYSFGIVLMELLTGRLPGAGSENDGEGLESLVRKVFQEERPLSEIIDPALLSEVHAKKQVIAVFHISLNCTELDPELRPRMRTVSESLDRIKLH
ncbi:hypothetical protein D5086_029029 [Populus alba]|uniref:Uncharacterized protein n=1 Tax=Populus alba TaxID=43335 RepID=A0ACC4ASD8_POPAL